MTVAALCRAAAFTSENGSIEMDAHAVAAWHNHMYVWHVDRSGCRDLNRHCAFGSVHLLLPACRILTFDCVLAAAACEYTSMGCLHADGFIHICWQLCMEDGINLLSNGQLLSALSEASRFHFFPPASSTIAAEPGRSSFFRFPDQIALA